MIRGFNWQMQLMSRGQAEIMKAYRPDKDEEPYESLCTAYPRPKIPDLRDEESRIVGFTLWSNKVRSLLAG
jgi:hypothetical protein